MPSVSSAKGTVALSSPESSQVSSAEGAPKTHPKLLLDLGGVISGERYYEGLRLNQITKDSPVSSDSGRIPESLPDPKKG